MGYSKLVWVCCDGEGCGDTTAEYDARTQDEAWAIAKELGYTTKAGQHLCQACTEGRPGGQPRPSRTV